MMMMMLIHPNCIRARWSSLGHAVIIIDDGDGDDDDDDDDDDTPKLY